VKSSVFSGIDLHVETGLSSFLVKLAGSFVIVVMTPPIDGR